MTFLKNRDRRPEVMDQPDLDEHEHRVALRGLKRVNRISATTTPIWKALAALAKGCTTQPLRVLDLGSGGGDVAIALARRARKEGMGVSVHGADISPRAVELAREAARGAQVDCEFFAMDVVHDPLPAGYDVIMSSLFLHHFDEAVVQEILQKAAAASGRAVLMDDLRRTAAGYLLCWVGCRMLTRSRVVHTDGPLSVRAAWTLDEIRKLADASGLTAARIRRHWPQRFLLSWERP